jgi:2'-5' RNA ligase/GNAT superfamily N-acetyltransferase
VARVRLAAALLVPQPLATEFDGLRRALGARERTRIAPHITLVPPATVGDRDLLVVLDALRAAGAAASGPIDVEVGPATTFAPATPTVHLAVAGDLDAIVAVRDALRVGPLDRPDRHDFVPHLTLAQEATPEAIAAATALLAGFREPIVFDRVHLLRHDGEPGWVPIAEARLGPSATATRGRGGLEVAITVSGRLDLEAAALLAVDGAGAGEGRPFAVTARRHGRVVGAAWGWTNGAVAVVADLAVATANRGEGIGRHVLAAVVAEAVARGATVALLVAPTDGAPAALRAGAGWTPAGDAVSDGRRLWRRVIASTA